MQDLALFLDHPNLNIKKLKIADCKQNIKNGTKYLLDGLQSNTCLRSLEIRWVYIGDEGAKAAANLLQRNTTLTELSLPFGKIKGRGATDMVESLCKHNTSLKSLNLSSNYLEEEYVERIGECLGMSSHLTRLSYSFCDLEGDVLRVFLNGLLKNTHLCELLLSGHNFHERNNTKRIADYLNVNTNLTSLVLQDCKIGEEDVANLEDVFINNTSLTSINLSDNKVGKEGGKKMAKVIKMNSSLRDIQLSKCGIGKEEFLSICESVAGNSSIIRLDLSYHEYLELLPYNAYLDKMERRCLDDLKKNKYLITLCNFDRCSYSWMEEIEKRNRGIWRERIKWSCVLNVIWRVMTIGECFTFPAEMIHAIVSVVPPDGLLREEEMRRIVNYATDISTIGREKLVFLEKVFNKGIDILLKRILTKSSLERLGIWNNI